MKLPKIKEMRSIGVRPAPVALTISLLLLLVFHTQFFKTVTSNVEPGFNGCLITVSMALLLLLLNFFFFYLLLGVCGKVGKALTSFFLIGNSLGLYFLNSYHALIDDRMMGNVFHTTMDEASSFFSMGFVLYVLFLGLLPTALLWYVRIRRDSWKMQLAGVFAPLVLTGAVVGVNTGNFLWIDRNVPVFGSQLLPWSYVINTFRYIGAQRRANVKEIPLPDARITDSTRAAVVLVIGESARSRNFQLCGYERQTNPKLSTLDGLKAYKAISVAANTIDATRAIVTRQEEAELHEILPNYLYRNGAGVMWQSSNWGEPPLHIPFVRNRSGIAEQTGLDGRYDGILFNGVREFIDSCAADKVLAVVHTYTSHGPAYFENYPPEFEVFVPVCKSVEVADVPHGQLVNAYDNTIVYTDALLYDMISQLKGIKNRKCALIFLSDHGESLGENGRYMHGAAPGAWENKVQEYEIPFIVWSSDPMCTFKDVEEVDQHYVYHSVLDFLGMDCEFFDESRSVFRQGPVSE